MGTLHAENAQRLGGAELVAVAAAREGRAEEVGRRLGVAHGTYPELFAREDVDAVILAARSVDHGPLAVDVLRSGKHLFLEKPGATSLAEHDTLRRESAARPGQVVQVGYMRRFDRGFAEAHRRVRAGDGGTPLVILLTSRDTEWPEGEDPRDTGGFLLDMASHDYDAACWLFDDEPVEVSVARQSLVYPVLSGLGDLDNGVVTVRFARGGIAVTHVSRTSAFGHDIRCEIVGSEGSVFVRGPGDGTADLIDRSDADCFPPDYRARFATAYIAELTAFVAACNGSGPAAPTLDDDRRAVATGIAARASAVAGRPLAVGTDWPWP
ncbi:MAG: scyllo-inositol 2-dehydrogenase [Gaiellaceae bacterium]|jgi:scyllo-inositol 2-dehydrogenase (NAD+)|nr:scyllo-inositol 2-dehydrogenase [Gaiellaceae bacterium]